MSPSTLTGVTQAASLVTPGMEVIVDANLGIVIAEIPAGVRRWYDFEQAKFARIAQRLAKAAAQPLLTRDGRRIEVAANISSAEEAAAAFAQGAEGIGLFRTEHMFYGKGAEERSEERRVGERV